MKINESKSESLWVKTNRYEVKDWIWGAKIGEGAFGSAKKCTSKDDKDVKVAIK